MHEITGQTHWHEPSGFKRAGFGKFGRPKTPYDLFMESEDIPIYRDIGVQQGAEPAAQALGADGRPRQLTFSCTAPKANGAPTSSKCRAPARSIRKSISTRKSISSSKAAARPKSGSKATASATSSNGRRARCSRFPSMRCTASSMPAPRRRCCIGGTTAPNLMNLINDVGAIYDCPYQFRDRFSGADDFYKYKDDIEPDPVRGLAMRRTNFVPDIVNCDLPLDNRRSPGYRRVEPLMTGNTFYLWIAQHENGHYSKAHAHTSAAVLICLKGKGYTYTWPEHLGITPWKDGKADQVKRVDYEQFGMVSAAPGGARWYPPAFRRLEGAVPAHRLVRAAQSRPRARPARREAHRLHRDGYSRRRQRDPLLHGGSVPAPGICRAAQARRRREPHAAGILRAGLSRTAAEGIVAAHERRYPARRRRRPHLLFQHRAHFRRRRRIVRALGRRRYRLVDLASRVLAHRAGAARQPAMSSPSARASISPTSC